MRQPLHILSCLSFALAVGALPLQAQAKPAAKKAVPQTAARTAAPAAAPQKGASVEGITEYTLANGMKVLLVPDEAKPTITVNIVYKNGSRHESYGESGMAHILEHILFNGTKRFPGGMKELEALGAEFNGTTWLDRTHYYVSFKADDAKLLRALEIEADRMRNARVEQPILDKEMKIITNEFEIGENSPGRVLMQRVNHAAFDWHAYGRDTIGAKSDIQNVKLDYVRAYYDRFYQPDNAVLVVAGRIEEAKTLALVNKLFGAIPRPTRTLHATYTVDGVQDGERSVTLRRSGGTPIVTVAYKVPAASHVDAATLNAVADMLTDTPGGRLYKALVETHLATEISSMGLGTQEPGLLQFIATLPKDGDPEKVKAVLIQELEGLGDKPFTQEELTAAKLRIAKQYDMQQADTKSLAIGLTEHIAAGDWRLFHLTRDRIAKTTTIAARNAAQTYFRTANRTVGMHIPTDNAVRSEIPAIPDVANLVASYKGRAVQQQGEAFDATPANVEKRTQLFTAPNGLKGALLPKKTKGAYVTASLNLHFASEEALKAHSRGAMGLMADMLMRGTATKDRKQIQAAFDALKAQVNVGGGGTSINATVTTTRENLAPSLRLLAEVLKTPAFPASELESLVKEQVTAIEGQLKEPQPLISQWLQKTINAYPAGHPLAFSSLEDTIKDLQATKADQVKAFYQAMVGADHATFACVGDHDAKEVQALVTELFGSWKAQTPYQRIAAKIRMAPAEQQVIETPDKQMAIYLAVQPLELSQDHPDYPALALASQMYGGGAKSRIFDRLRQKENMSYGAGGQFTAQPQDKLAMWIGFAMFGPKDRARLEAAAMEELKKAVETGFTQAELDEARKVYLQQRESSRQEDGAIAGWLNGSLYLGRPVSFPAQMDAKFKSLTLEEVNSAVKRHIDPAKTLIGLAGDFKAAKS